MAAVTVVHIAPGSGHDAVRAIGGGQVQVGPEDAVVAADHQHRAVIGIQQRGRTESNATGKRSGRDVAQPRLGDGRGKHGLGGRADVFKKVDVALPFAHDQVLEGHRRPDRK